MSQHIFKTTCKGQKICITLGYDRPLRRFFLLVQQIESPVHGSKQRSVSARAPAFRYTNLGDPHDAGTLDYYWGVLETLGISVPAKMFIEVNRDARRQVGNRVVEHFARRKMKVLYP
jgi:hypothetical protein